jgi:hypothetical protein
MDLNISQYLNILIHLGRPDGSVRGGVNLSLSASRPSAVPPGCVAGGRPDMRFSEEFSDCGSQ